MTFLPIVARELRVAARRRGTYWTRVGAAFVAIGTAAFMLMRSNLERHQSPSDLGKSIFMTLSGFAFLYCLMTGARNTADCLSDEKREGTLGLLFLTDLKGYDVVLGKLVATSLNSFYGLLAFFPVLAIPLLLGGVAVNQFWRMVLLLTNTLFFSLAVGMWVSSMGRHERKTVSGTIALILFVTGGLPLCGMTFDYYLLKPPHDGPPIFTLLPSPGFAFFLGLESWFKPAIDPRFWWSLLTTHVLSWGFLSLASARLPHAWQDKPASVRTVRWQESWKQWSYGDSAERKNFRHRLMSMNPFFWLAGRDRLKPAYVWGFLGMVAVGWLWGLAELKQDWLEPAVFVMTALTLHSVLKVWLASEACQRFNQDRQSGALELLLSTPLKVNDILRGQLLALKRQFFYPVVAVVLMDVLFLFSTKDRGEWASVWLAGMVVLVADLYTLSWVGMWLGLKSKDTNRATGSALGRILILPWVIFYLGMLFVSGLQIRIPLLSNNEPESVIIFWFALGITIDIFFYGWARNNLNQDFRLLATQRFESGRRRVRWWRLWARENVSPAPPVIPS
jgi:ABC-type transport system involved in cytochrome c biogenesis permease component